MCILNPFFLELCLSFKHLLLLWLRPVSVANHAANEIHAFVGRVVEGKPCNFLFLTLAECLFVFSFYEEGMFTVFVK